MTWTTLLVSERTPDGTAYEVIGAAEAEPVVLIHGLGLCRDVWNGMLPDFVGYRVINFDLYGHGESTPPSQTASLSVYAAQIAHLLDHLRVEVAHIVGFSIGGMINRRFALDFPDRVASLVILNSPHDRGEDGQRQVEERAKTVRDQGAMATMDAALARWFTPDYLAVGCGPSLVRRWRDKVDPESYAQAAWVLAHGVRELIAPTPPIEAPSLVMTCENDSGSTPAMSHSIAAEIAGAEVQIIPSLQHLGLMEAPNAFSSAITEFLRKTKT